MTDDVKLGLVTCGACASLVLPRNHCSVCGHAILAVETTRRYAADRAEPVMALRLATTLFPRLPRADLDAFRLALAAGIVVVVALAAAGLLPVALLASALLVPLLLTVYLYSTDVYEDEPIRVILVTLAWGALAGALFGLLLRELYPARVVPPADESLEILARVVVLPSVGMGLAMVGPLALLRYRKFDDVLDGATFGAVSGSMFVGAQVIAQSIDLVMAGAQPGGDTWSWVMRILEHAVAVPLIIGGAAAGACGAFWLRYRAPVRDRARLGRLGRPAVATLLACLFSVSTSAALVLLRDLPRLIALGALTVLALVWLRHLIDLGLREEAVEAATDEEQTCPSCHRPTPPGSFCTWCGVALRALPKRSSSGAPSPDTDTLAGSPAGTGTRSADEATQANRSATSRTRAPRHSQPSRLAGGRALVAFLVGLALVVAGAVLLVQLLAPVARPPCPDPTQPCPAAAMAASPAAPRLGQPGEAVLRFGQTHAVDGSAWQLDFDPRWWLLDTSEPGATWLTTTYVATTVRGNVAEIPLSLRLEIVPAAEATREKMMERLGAMAAQTLEGTAERDEHGTRLLRPHIGFQPADARYLVGDFGEAGAMTPFGAHLLAASDGRFTAGMVLYVSQPEESFPFFAGSVRTTRAVGDLLDDIVKRFYWTSTGP
jgi:hypothetical protein